MPAPADNLSALLRRADPAAGAPSPALSADAFAAAVHARIQSADTASARLRRSGFASQLFPLAAALAIIASLAAGGSLAYAGAQRAQTEIHASAYARTIDPWLMHADRSAASPSNHAAHAHR
jgi:hypothetical protein